MKIAYTALLLAVLPLTNANANEGIYIGVGAGIVGMDLGQNVDFPADGISLVPDDSTGIGQLFAGYRFANNWGVELGYQQFKSEASKSQQLSITTEREWDAEMTAKQFFIKPVYFWEFAPTWTLKSGLGLSYSDYDFSGGSHDDIEVGFDQEIEQGRGTVDSTENGWGVTGSVAVDYHINENWLIGTELSVVADDIVTNYQLFANLSYHF